MRFFPDCPNTHPVTNKYTGQVVYAPCGKCFYCKQKRAQHQSARIAAEGKLHPYNLFFTLTYKNEDLPLAVEFGEYYDTHPEERDFLCSYAEKELPFDYELFLNFKYYHNRSPKASDKLYVLKDPSPNVPYAFFSPRLDRWRGFEDCYDLIPPRPRVNDGHPDLPYKDCFAVCRKWDIQKFIKRLRKSLAHDSEGLLKKITKYERNFRYYLVAEYGPRSLRPHYHGLFFCDRKEVSDAIRECYIYKAWSYGRKTKHDCEYVKYDCARYIAQYITCQYHLPRVLDLKYSKTFALASSRPSLGVSPTSIQGVYRNTVNRVYETIRSTIVNGVVCEQSSGLAPQVLRQIYPRCTNFEGLADDIQGLARVYFPYTNEYKSKVEKDEKLMSGYPYTQFLTKRVVSHHYSQVELRQYGLPFFDGNRLSKDGSSYFDYNNMACANIANKVCVKFHLTPAQYLSQLVEFYKDYSHHKYKKCLQDLVECSESYPNEHIQHAMIFDSVRRFISYCPYHLYPDERWCYQGDDFSMLIPEYWQDMFNIHDMEELMAFYKPYKRHWIFDDVKFTNAYNIENTTPVVKQRLEDHNRANMYIRTKKLHNHPNADKFFGIMHEDMYIE